jgi:hypothetical protein
MTVPLAGKSLVVKPGNPVKSWRAGKSGDILPLFVALQDLQRNGGTLFIDAPMLEDQPHVK